MIKPIGNKVAIKRDEVENKVGGIFLPENSKEKPKTGTVVAVGEGNVNPNDGQIHALSVTSGDRVIFGSYAGVEVTIGDYTYLIVEEKDILAIIDNE